MKQNELKEALRDYKELPEVQQLSPEDKVRINKQPKLVSRYYDLVTKFYELGWGATFHFSPRRPGENLRASQRRHDEGIAKLLGLEPGMKVADIGCGICGPLVTIAQASGAAITGINFNAQQNANGTDRVRRTGLSDSCTILYADFMNVPLPDNTFDALYSFEALCHAPNRRMAFVELHRLLKPGGEAALVDWALTGLYDETDHRHHKLRSQIETANATPDLARFSEYLDSVQSAGFEVIHSEDQQAVDGNQTTPWYMALQGRDVSMSSIARTPVGRAITAASLRLLENLKLVRSGTAETSQVLNVAADALVEAGELGIFTPSFLVHARKPK